MTATVNFEHVPGGNRRPVSMSLRKDQLIANDIGISWKVNEYTTRIIPYSHISEITIVEV